MGLKAAGADPNQFGFTVDREFYKYTHHYLSTHLLYHTAHWKAIQAEYRRNKAKWVHDTDVNWILNFRFNHLKIYFKFAIRKLKRILHIED